METILYSTIIMFLALFLVVNFYSIYLRHIRVEKKAIEIIEVAHDIYNNKGVICNPNTTGKGVVFYPVWDNETNEVKYKCVLIEKN